MRPVYMSAVRAPNRPRRKWHLLIYATSAWTICGKQARDWDTADRGDLSPDDICTNCLRDTP